MLGVDGVQALAAISRLEQPVSLMPQQRHQKLPVGRQVVNDQDRRHPSLSVERGLRTLRD